MARKTPLVTLYGGSTLTTVWISTGRGGYTGCIVRDDSDGTPVFVVKGYAPDGRMLAEHHFRSPRTALDAARDYANIDAR